MLRFLQKNWPIYLIEAWALGMFLLSASFFTILIQTDAFPIHMTIASPLLRRFLIGVAMGTTAIALIYSSWGKRSGAHMNPAVTLTHLQLNRIHVYDAIWYILAQFTGGTLGILLISWIAGSYLSDPRINYLATVPGSGGVEVAFAFEFLISFCLFLLVLFLNNHHKLAPYTGFFVGGILVLYITFEAPYSGMSMNPARTFASALFSHTWTAWYIYFTAPVLGMNLAGYLYRRWYRWQHNGNCLTMDCHSSGKQHDNKVYEVLGPKRILEKYSPNATK